MIEKYELEKGLKVVYVPSHLKNHKYTSSEVEHGVVTSWNDSYVFVDYDNSGRGKATRFEDLFLRHIIKAGRMLS